LFCSCLTSLARLPSLVSLTLSLAKAEPGSNSAATGGFSGLVAGSIASIAAGGRDGRAVTLTVDQSYAAGEEVCCSYGVRVCLGMLAQC